MTVSLCTRECTLHTLGWGYTEMNMTTSDLGKPDGTSWYSLQDDQSPYLSNLAMVSAMTTLSSIFLDSVPHCSKSANLLWLFWRFIPIHSFSTTCFQENTTYNSEIIQRAGPNWLTLKRIGHCNIWFGDKSLIMVYFLCPELCMYLHASGLPTYRIQRLTYSHTAKMSIHSEFPVVQFPANTYLPHYDVAILFIGSPVFFIGKKKSFFNYWTCEPT